MVTDTFISEAHSGSSAGADGGWGAAGPGCV